jgi:hypothetical protein
MHDVTVLLLVFFFVLLQGQTTTIGDEYAL